MPEAEPPGRGALTVGSHLVSGVSARFVQTCRFLSNQCKGSCAVHAALSMSGHSSLLDGQARRGGGHWFEPSTAHFRPHGCAKPAWLREPSGPDVPEMPRRAYPGAYLMRVLVECENRSRRRCLGNGGRQDSLGPLPRRCARSDPFFGHSTVASSSWVGGSAHRSSGVWAFSLARGRTGHCAPRNVSTVSAASRESCVLDPSVVLQQRRGRGELVPHR
jgi:hypothetical protein